MRYLGPRTSNGVICQYCGEPTWPGRCMHCGKPAKWPEKPFGDTRRIRYVERCNPATNGTDVATKPEPPPRGAEK